MRGQSFINRASRRTRTRVYGGKGGRVDICGVLFAMRRLGVSGFILSRFGFWSVLYLKGWGCVSLVGYSARLCCAVVLWVLLARDTITILSIYHVLEGQGLMANIPHSLPRDSAV